MGLRGWIIVLALTQDTDTSLKDAPKIKPAAGKIGIWRSEGSKLETLEAESAIHPDDRLGVKEGETASFATEGPLLVTLRAVKAAKDKGLALERKKGRVVMKLFDGDLVVQSYDSEVEVHTPHANVSGKGSYFTVHVGSGSTKVVALEGQLTVSNGDLGSVNLEDGEGTEVKKGKAPSKPTVMQPDWMSDARGMENLFNNPGLETNDFKGWNVKDAAVNALAARGGKLGLDLNLAGPKTKKWFYGRNVFKTLKPGTKYMFRFWYRTRKVECDKTPVDLILHIDLCSPDNKNDKFPHPLKASDGRWKCKTVFHEAIAPNFRFDIMVEREGSYTGGVFMDDFELYEFPK